MRIRFLGHASFDIEAGGHSLLVDPYLTGNPAASAKPDDFSPQYILVTHGHDDHIADVESIARRSGATVVATNEIAEAYAKKGLKAHPIHIGGRTAFPFGALKMVVAHHGNGPFGGSPAGIILESEGRKAYFAGDTALYSDMKLIGDLWGPIDVAFLPIGSNFTMDAADAAVAAQWIHAKIVVPIHYNTWDNIKADPEAYKRDVEGKCASKVHILEPGQDISV